MGSVDTLDDATLGDGCRREKRWTIRPSLVALGIAATLTPAFFGSDQTTTAAPTEQTKARIDAALAGHDHSTHDHGDGNLEQRFTEMISDQTGFDMSSHEGMEGPMLGPDWAPHTTVKIEPRSCPSGAEIKLYDVVAINVSIMLNRWGDHDPDGYMFALRDQVEDVRAQERSDESDHWGLSLGIGADAIQPLTIRANVGDCLIVSMENELPEPASFSIHGADVVISSTGDPALTTNPDATAMPGRKVVYEWFIDPEQYDENTHYAHSHGARERFQVGHGLFGAVVVEPEGSAYFDNRTGESLCRSNGDGVSECRNSWDAMISPGDGSSDFREFALFYHEVGNERYAVLDKDGIPNPSIDPVVHSYKPNGRAINYRSESFFRRLGEAENQVAYYADWLPDESEAYGSYAFGDPAMPIPQTYVGDPIKFRLIHAGSETFHVPHLHGGGIQWQRQQDVGADGADGFVSFDAGLRKDFDNTMPSSGNDSQTIGPSETYELEISCGSGGCQMTAGDFLFHCHVASHYISGMWHFWRVYNTLQDDLGKTDDLAVVAELPDRVGSTEPAVTSDRLVGETVEFAGNSFTVTEELLPSLVELQLPPAGIKRDEQDAEVMDWQVRGLTYLNEPETTYTWPNFSPDDPGGRRPMRFDPVTGKLAIPFLRPHLGSRPPFAPRHGPAPHLEPDGSSTADPPQPGRNGATSLCPDGAPVRSYNVHAITTDIPINDQTTDETGMIFVIKENEASARSDPDFKYPLAIRANQGDCVDVVLVNELEQQSHGPRPNLMKTNIHIHFVQFDVLASDGVISGANYEQAVRPFTQDDLHAVIMTGAESGDRRLAVDDTSIFHVGSAIAVGIDQMPHVMETAEIEAIEGDDLVLREPLRNNHGPDEKVSAEFVRYRWYVARQNGAIYFHDHVDALTRWGKGLFGALIAEPRGSSYHDPRTGADVLSGPYADIHTEQQVVPGLDGSFREAVLFMNDRNPLTGASFNLRAEPLHRDTDRGSGPPELALSSIMYGDPATPIIRAYLGDPLMFRILTSATEEVHPFHITGHTFRQERFQESSPPLTSFGVGISERFNAYVEAAGGEAGLTGDYLYYNGAERHFREGAWGILRVVDGAVDGLQPLPGLEPPPPGDDATRSAATGRPESATDPGRPCPAGAPEVTFGVTAIELPIDFNVEAGLGIVEGKMYVLDEEVDAVLSGEQPPEPLVIRANAGDCLLVELTNETSQPVSFHLDALAVDPTGSLGITVGTNPEQSVQPGQVRSYAYWAPSELGTVLIRDFGNIYRNGREGLYGALIVEPADSRYLDPYTGRELRSGVEAVVVQPGKPDFREFVTIFQDNDPDIGLFVMPYDTDVNKLVGVNYRAEPLTVRLARLGLIADSDLLTPDLMALSTAIYDPGTFGDPSTNVFMAHPGDPIRFRVVSGYSEQNQVFSVEAHLWELTPTIDGSDVVSSRYLTPGGVLNVEIASAGGPQTRIGDYLWGNHRLPYHKAGQWGLLRVTDPATAELLPLPDRP